MGAENHRTARDEPGDPAAEALSRRYSLPPGHAPVLADTGDTRYQAYNGTEIVRAARSMAELVKAMRGGGAPPPLPWAPEGRPEFNRAVFLNQLARNPAWRTGSRSPSPTRQDPAGQRLARQMRQDPAGSASTTW